MNAKPQKPISPEKKALEILEKMTLEEKVSQLVNGAAEIKRLNIKEYDWWNEALHGVARAGTATVFPQAIGLAASWDCELLQNVAESISDEARAKYNIAQKEGNYERYSGLTFWSPNINIFRDPRWGRGQETYGEDPHLTSRLAERFIKGMQGNGEHLKTAACVKHFAAHSGPEGGRFSFDSKVTKKDMRETYLPAFEYCVKQAKPETVMASYNSINGVPACCNGALLNDLLRKEWGFDGHVVSDCGAVREISNSHHYAADETEAAALAIKNGCDLNCGSAYEKLIDAYEQDMVEMEDIDRALLRLMKTRVKLGMFDDSTEYDGFGSTDVCSAAHKTLCEQITRKSIVLLKNDGILPLNADNVGIVAVIGPNADCDEVLLGNYNGFPDEYINIKRGLELRFGKEKIKYAKGCSILTGDEDEVCEAAKLAADCDVTVLCLGLNSRIEGEQGDADGDRTAIELPEIQQQLLERVCEKTKNVILVLLSGSAVAVPYAQEHCAAVINAWYPGEMGGKAVAELICGDYSPSGVLPITYYRSTADLPPFFDYSMRGRTYKYFEGEPLYPFGFGLHYTKFEYSDLSVDNGTARVTVKNLGGMKSGTVVQIYVDSAGEKNQPVRRLIGFTHAQLDAGESRTIEIELDGKAFCLVDDNGEWYSPNGKFTVYAGGSQPDERSAFLGADCTVSLIIE